MRRFTWFTWLLIASGLIRLYLVFCTEGSFDVQLWETHAANILKLGLSGYYASDVAKTTVFNHPPMIGSVVAGLFWLCSHTGIAFKIVFRLLLTSTDYLTAYYLYRIFRNSPDRRLVVAGYLLNPLTIIFSAYHGNTDPLIALCVTLSLYFISRKHPVAAGIALGCGMWVKWIVLLVLPAFFFALPVLRQKLKYLAALALACFLGYAWQFGAEPAAMLHRVFGYKGQLVQTTAGIPIWGNRIVVDWLLRLLNWENTDFMYYFLHYNQAAIVLLVTAYCWLRRRGTEPMELGRTIGGAFIIFYAATNFWSFQYLVWITPFLCFLERPLRLTVTITCSAYVYALYSVVCDSPFLLGTWDFIGHPQLSEPVLILRTLAVISLIAVAIYLYRNALVPKRPYRSAPGAPAPKAAGS